MITLTANQAVRASQALAKLNDNYKFPMKQALVLAANQRALEAVQKSFEEERMKIVKEFGTDNGAGGFAIEPAVMGLFNDTVNELADQPIELEDLRTMKIDELLPEKTATIEPGILVPLDWMFE